MHFDLKCIFLNECVHWFCINMLLSTKCTIRQHFVQEFVCHQFEDALWPEPMATWSFNAYICLCLVLMDSCRKYTLLATDSVNLTNLFTTPIHVYCGQLKCKQDGHVFLWGHGLYPCAIVFTYCGEPYCTNSPNVRLLCIGLSSRQTGRIRYQCIYHMLWSYMHAYIANMQNLISSLRKWLGRLSDYIM